MGVPLILIAASGLAREVLACLEGQYYYEVVGILDDSPALQGTSAARVPVLGPVSSVVDHPQAQVLVCAGKGTVRAAIIDRLIALGVGEERFGTVIDPSVRVRSSCSVGAGSILLAGTVLTADVTVGRHVVIMPNVTLTHDDRVDDFATLCAGVTLGGTVQVGAAAYLGMNSSVRENLTVGAGSTLGMGAALTRDLPAGETWIGTPARRLQQVGAPASLLPNFEAEGLPA
jgi:sugar O-acyltransferase (sialic acid O-acetyltransferase NeuD family)